MAVYNTKVSKVEIGDFSEVDGSNSNWVEIPAYKDTVKISEAEPSQTKHYQAGKSSPKKIVFAKADETYKLSIMDTSAAMLATALGGSVDTVNLVDTWSKSKSDPQEVIKGLRITTGDGAVILIPRGSWVAVKNFDLTDTGIALIDVTVTPTDTGFPAIADVQISDPA